MPKVSIVVPVYKVEKYLDRCLSSLIKQTLQDIEIILVDDGSPDQSSGMCDRYLQLDSRIKVIHKKNGGLSSARNTGISIAEGEYIGFVDSDDDVELTMYERLYETAIKTGVDYVMSDYMRFYTDGSIEQITKRIEGGLYDKDRIRKIIFPQLIMNKTIDYGPCLSVCLALYKREFLCLSHLWFDKEVRWSEDNIFSAIATHQCNSFYYLKGVPLYHYRQNPETITTSYRQGAWDVYTIMNKHLHEYFDKVTDFNFDEQLKVHMIYYACVCIKQEGKRNPSSYAMIKKILNSDELRESFRGFMLPDVPLKFKLRLLMMKYRLSFLLSIV